ncbi:MAG: hypothetical protein JJU27_07590 [Gammaproteobacteria bacterium]|nr:hypothetical protein [Gammaproteobacteria bacterium]
MRKAEVRGHEYTDRWWVYLLLLLCFHQVPNASHVFARFLVEVSAQRDAYAIDTPGFGMSDGTAGEQTIADYAPAMMHELTRDFLGTASP